MLSGFGIWAKVQKKNWGRGPAVQQEEPRGRRRRQLGEAGIEQVGHAAPRECSSEKKEKSIEKELKGNLYKGKVEKEQKLGGGKRGSYKVRTGASRVKIIVSTRRKKPRTRRKEEGPGTRAKREECIRPEREFEKRPAKRGQGLNQSVFTVFSQK